MHPTSCGQKFCRLGFADRFLRQDARTQRNFAPCSKQRFAIFLSFAFSRLFNKALSIIHLPSQKNNTSAHTVLRIFRTAQKSIASVRLVRLPDVSVRLATNFAKNRPQKIWGQRELCSALLLFFVLRAPRSL